MFSKAPGAGYSQRWGGLMASYLHHEVCALSVLQEAAVPQVKILPVSEWKQKRIFFEPLKWPKCTSMRKTPS